MKNKSYNDISLILLIKQLIAIEPGKLINWMFFNENIMLSNGIWFIELERRMFIEVFDLVNGIQYLSCNSIPEMLPNAKILKNVNHKLVEPFFDRTYTDKIGGIITSTYLDPFTTTDTQGYLLFRVYKYLGVQIGLCSRYISKELTDLALSATLEK